MANRVVTIVGAGKLHPVIFGNDRLMSLIAGPCQIETLDHALRTATAIAAIADLWGVPFVYKSSYDKANRTSFTTPRGPGLEEGLRILEEVRQQVGVPVTTDVHSPEEAYTAAMTVDMVQIPAMLSRQTDLLSMAGYHGKAVSIKKMTTMAPGAMLHAVNKVKWGQKGNGEPPILIERGSAFGYQRLINDMAGLEVMKAFGPVVFDATHSVQFPSAEGEASGGNRALIAPLARAAVAVGIAGVFLEVHEDPDNAPSDGPCMLPLGELGNLLSKLKQIDEAVKANPS